MFLSNENKTLYDKYFDVLSKKINEYMITSNLYPNEALLNLLSIKNKVPEKHPFFKEIENYISTIN